MKKTKDDKTKSSNWIPILMFAFIGGICGYVGGNLIVGDLVETGGVREALFSFVWLIVCLYLAMLIQIIVHEGGHYLFGKASGYKFVSFRIGNRMLVSEAGNYKLKKFSIVGTCGQCLMMPPEGDGYNVPYVLYNLGGSITNIAFSIICLLVYILLSPITHLALIFIISFIIGFAFALMNGIPMKLGGMANDGYNAISLGKDKEARHAFWLQLYINGLLASGTRLRDMPSEWFELLPDLDLSNPIICTIGMLRCGYLHDKKQFEEAKVMCEFMIDSAPGTLEVHKNELRCELLFYEIIGLCRKEVIDTMYSKQLQKYIKATLSYVSRRRLLYSYELLVKQNEVEARNQRNAFKKASQTYPYPSEIESERELIAYITDKSIG